MAGEHGNGIFFCQPCLQDGKGCRAAGDQRSQYRQRRRGQYHHGNGRRRIADVVGLHGAAHLPEQGEVPGEHRLVPHLNFHPVAEGEGADAEIHQRRGVKDIPQQERSGQQQKADRQGVQHNQQGLGAVICQH